MLENGFSTYAARSASGRKLPYSFGTHSPTKYVIGTANITHEEQVQLIRVVKYSSLRMRCN